MDHGDDLQELGFELRRRRHQLGWSQPDVADRTDLSVDQVSRAERGIPGTPAYVWAQMARVVGARLTVVDIGDE
jgi:transcriptional regulator with XRE-family HTH domain